MSEKAKGFAPIVGKKATHLILGTMPGQRSLAESAYYAHPRNAFWPIMTAWLDWPPSLSYQERCARLSTAPVIVWDVLASCVRPGSLDSAIQADSIVPNDFAMLLTANPTISTVLYNGAKASQLFARHVIDQQALPAQELSHITLPSTSPAFASMPLAEKRRRWLAALPTLGAAFQ
ncbi:MAG: DNA-deoxyinosine glycosylase [Pseudomonadota bacterium]